MIECQNISLQAGEFKLKDMSLRVESGQYAVVMGKTGIGKTTILEAVCGLRKIQKGKVLIDGVEVTRWSPRDRNLGYVPQDLALFPTVSVKQHLEFAMKLRKFSATERATRAEGLADLLGIGKLMHRKVQKLSGGEKQRVAIGRALSFSPSGLLLDEPLSALDSETRRTTQDLLRNIHKQTGVSVLHVTHQQDEADALGDICVRLVANPETGIIESVVD